MMSSKRAFTLIEMLVVIGIIGILAGVLFASFGGATESARAAQCLTNMRALAMAANARAMSAGGYPLAGSREAYGTDEDTGGLWYTSQPGWISWLSYDKYDDGKGHARTKQSMQAIDTFPFYGTGKEEDALFAVTNGSLWISCNRNKALYTCPEHVLYRKDQKYGKPLFSYVMNARFGWDYTKGGGSIAASGAYAIGFGDLTRADKTLMFAELPTEPVGGEEKSKDKPEGLKADCVLQYLDVKASGSNKKDGLASESGEAESIGFVHKVGKKKRCAHVAFADGHTEKLVWAEGGVDPKTLTAYLCKGWDVTFSAANGWTLAQDADKVE